MPCFPIIATCKWSFTINHAETAKMHWSINIESCLAAPVSPTITRTDRKNADSACQAGMQAAHQGERGILSEKTLCVFSSIPYPVNYENPSIICLSSDSQNRSKRYNACSCFVPANQRLHMFQDRRILNYGDETLSWLPQKQTSSVPVHMAW